jgi:CRP/FNR family transcriptional regulator, anaerobic regulatory protein
MKNKEIYYFLRKEIPELSETDLINFCAKWTISKSLKRNEISTLSGKETNLYFIKKGAVKIFTEIEDRQVILEFGYKGLCIFNLPSFFSEKPSGYFFEAIRNTEFTGINKENFFCFIEKNQIVANYWRKSIERMLLNFVEREVDILTHSPKIRYQRLLARKPELFQNIPKKYIANYLGLSPETLSRLSNS